MSRAAVDNLAQLESSHIAVLKPGCTDVPVEDVNIRTEPP